MMRLTDSLQKTLTDRLDEHRIVVWYDGEGAFGDFVRDFKAAHCRVVSAAGSALLARREAEAVYRGMEESDRPAEANANLLIYIPHARAPQEQRTQDPFEGFAAAGCVFGEAESERLQSLARAAMPELVEQIDGLFWTGRPTLELLDKLRLTSAYPLVEEALGTQSAVEACVALLGSDTAAARVDNVPGARAELLNLLHSELGFTPGKRDLTGFARPGRQAGGNLSGLGKSLREQLATYVLLSELAFDLSGPWPDSLADVPRAEFKHRDRVYAVCERLRASDDTRPAYMTLANDVESALQLPAHFQGVTQFGQRDTFAFEEQGYLTALDAAVQAPDLPAACAIVEGRGKSVWRHQPERAQIWQVAERCINLLETAASLADSPGGLPAMVEAYTRAGGWSDLDRLQRLMEQSLADCAACDAVQAIVEFARRRYRESIDRLQERFLKQAQAEGWPPEGLLRQTQVFDRFIAPALEQRQKVAYVLADSLRFEMGRALAGELAALGELALQPAAAALPTTTHTGMAALLPGADGALSLREIGGVFIPHLGDRPLKDSAARMALLAEKYGDRFAHVTLGDWLDYAEKRRAALVGRVDLLVLRVPDIDELGEHVSLRQARKHMSDLLGDLKIAITQLARLGCDRIVVTADHGHVLLPEILPGDTATAPDGQWGLSKRRSKLGARVKEQPGSLIFSPGQLGIQTDAPDFCVPVGFSVYASDANYFHEGLSLPECIIPVVELRPKGRPESSGRQQQIEIRYPRDRFTSQVIGLKVYYASLFGEPLRVRLEAYDSAGPKGPPVGEAADSAARDENTHEVTLRPNAETDVPVLIEPDFSGAAVEIRAIAPDSGVVWARLKLENGILD
jgi:hypothetical protein